MVKVKLITRYPLSYCVDREKQEVTVDGKSGFVSVTSRADMAEDKFVIESDYINVENEVAFGKKIPTDGLVLEYTFFEGAGAVLHDTSGNDLNADIHGAVWYKLPTGKYVLSFDGKDDYTYVSSPLIDVRDEITLLCWTRMRRKPSKYSVVICGVLSDESNLFGKCWFEWTYSKMLKLSMFIDGKYNGSGFEIDLTDRWYFIGLIYDGKKKLGYLNGEIVHEYEVSGKLDSYTSFYIGTRHGNMNTGWNMCPDGLVGAVYYYDKALTKKQIDKIYKATAPLFGISP